MKNKSQSLLMPLGKALSGIPNLKVVDRWPATPKRARLDLNAFSRLEDKYATKYKKCKFLKNSQKQFEIISGKRISYLEQNACLRKQKKQKNKLIQVEHDRAVKGKAAT